MTAPINVSKVAHRSPFRYPGGKTWAVPYIQAWLKSLPTRPDFFCEPYAGGASVGLSVLFDYSAKHVWLAEADYTVAAVWKCLAYGKGKSLANKILKFEPTEENARAVLEKTHVKDVDQAFACILRNRLARGGIMAPGAGLMKSGENGKGMFCRWYPETIAQRILDIHEHHSRLFFFGSTFPGTSAWHLHQRFRTDENAVWFIDPPYPGPGKRLYRCNDVLPTDVLEQAQRMKGDVLITYSGDFDASLARTHGFDVVEVPMKTTHHAVKNELFIGRDLTWLRKELAARA